MLERYRQDKWHRLNFQLQVVNEEQVKTWDRLAEGPKREHVATAAEREHWFNTHDPQQTSEGGASTVATTKHLHLPKAKEWHKEHVRPQRSNTSRQPQSSNWQWQDWRSWQGGKNSGSSSFSKLSYRKTRTLHAHVSGTRRGFETTTA